MRAWSRFSRGNGWGEIGGCGAGRQGLRWLFALTVRELRGGGKEVAVLVCEGGRSVKRGGHMWGRQMKGEGGGKA